MIDGCVWSLVTCMGWVGFVLYSCLYFGVLLVIGAAFSLLLCVVYCCFHGYCSLLLGFWGLDVMLCFSWCEV